MRKLKEEENLEHIFPLTDIVPRISAKQKKSIYSENGLHRYDFILNTGEVVSRHINSILRLYVNGRRSPTFEPYCHGLFGYWAESVDDIKKNPVKFTRLPLYQVVLPNTNQVVDSQRSLEQYFYSTNGNNYPYDLKLKLVGGSPLIMFKSNGYPSGLTILNGKLRLVSTPLKGINQQGDLLFSVCSDKSEMSKATSLPAICLLGQELTFSNKTEQALTMMLKKASNKN